ncbi:MAG: hypothetical protein FIB04_09735 [Gammaproteobacteria bacterium]|nr:hypothetical protein [Gammaproteobacteria bacterium]
MLAHHSSSALLRRFVSATLAITALGVSTNALAQAAPTAQTAREAALEARVAELEKQVQALLSAQKAPAAAPAAAGAAPTTAAAAPAAKGPPPVQSSSIVPNAVAGTTFYFTGYAKADALWTNTPSGTIAENATGRDYYVPGQTPVSGDSIGTFFNFQVKQTRLIAGTETPFGDGDKLKTHVEVDFFQNNLNGTLGNQNVSNTYAPELRQAFIQTNHWLVGQAWSSFMNWQVLPETADFIGGTDGTIFIRQPQVRYTYGGFSIAAENPQTTITPYKGGTSISSDSSQWPDFIARYTLSGKWGTATLAGLVRDLRYKTAGANAYDTSTWTAAAALSGKINVFAKDDIRWTFEGGNLGRYVALNFTNDAVIDENRHLQSIDGFAGYVAYRHVWTDKIRSSLFYAFETYNNDEKWTGTAVNKKSESWTFNTFYSPIPKLDIGAEYRWAKREIESGDDGSLTRLQLTSKYSF